MGQFGDGPDGTLSHLGFALRNAVDVDAVARVVLRSLAALPEVSRVGLAISEGGGRRLRFLASDSDAWCHIDAYDDVPLTAVVRTGEAVLGGIDDFDGRFSGMRTRQREAGTRAFAALPLPGTGSPIGGLVVYFDTEQRFAGPQRRVLETAARRTAEAVQRVRSDAFGAEHETTDPDGEDPRSALLVLDDDPRAVGTARRFLRGLLAEWEVGGEVAETAQLCLSELVTNAVIHAGTTSVLTVRFQDDVLTVAVRDRGGAARPQVHLLEDDDPLKVCGRGLQLVDALSDRWGSEQDVGGTTSWFAIEVAGSAASSAQTG